MNPKAALKQTQQPRDENRWITRVHTMGRFGVGYGCAHCGTIFLGCRTMIEANQRLEMHRAAVREEDERRQHGDSNLLPEDSSS